MSKPLFAQDQSMFEGFWAYCVEQTIEDTHVPRTNLYEFSEDEIAQLGRNLGWSDFPEAVWAPNDGSWLILDIIVDEPGLCQAMSINDPVSHNVIEWNEKIANDDSFRSHGVADVEAVRSSGWATTPVYDGFVQISLMNVLFSTDPLANLSILTAARVGQSPASCELFPSKCN
ncbi:hypothetical protein [Loktanella sp. Alg231-35]|uniref:hypothetical protein n=1 Tax=Loktanella sp. Alg231-35 TaxID=1922220 RepID=UPI001F4037B1|nr:hypothetical protein [Loktanella sp. Alg231-35]